MKQIQIIGNLGRDASLYNGNGNEFVTFSVGVSERWKDNNGQPVERTDWFSVITKNKALLPYLKKGTKVFVQGKLTSKPYRHEQTGQYSVDMSVNANGIELLSAASNGQANGQPAGAPTPNGVPMPTGVGAQAIAGAEKADDDLPF